MEIEVIFKIAGIGVIISILNVVLTKAGRDEYVMLTTLAGIILVSLILLDDISELFSKLKTLFIL